MNKVFRVIWNHATQTWVAVSELAKAKGKSKGKTKSLTKLTPISVMVGMALAGNALAATANITPLKVSSTAGIAITNDGISKVIAGSDDPNIEPKHVIVIGDQSNHAYDETIMIGYKFSAYQYFGNAGANGKAGDTLVGNRIRIGGGANGKDSFGSALGYGAQIAGPSVAIGVGSRADTLNAEGWNATTAGGVAIGDFALSGGNINGSIGIGAIATADQDNSIAIGALSGATQKFSDRDLAYESGESGHTNHAKDYAINEHAAAATDAQRSSGGPKAASQMTSIGYKSAARGSDSIALGVNATTSKNIKQPVPGKEDQASQYYTKQSDAAVAIGNNAAAIKGESIALGHNAIAGGYTAQDIKALESEKTRLENMLKTAKTRKDQAEIDVNSHPTAENKFALASINATYERIFLALERIKADLNHAAANNQETTSTIAIGASAHANSTNAIALGYQAKASGVDSISVGHGNNVTGNYSGAFGDPNTVTGHHSYAFGNNNTVNANQAFVLGNKVTVDTSATDDRTGAVVLGDNSTVPTEVKAVNSAKIGAKDGSKLVYSGFAGNLGVSDTEGNPSKAAADKQGRFVSIGSNGNERQLKFVAAGEISATSTDAINGSQLYAFSDVVNNLATSTSTIIGGGATLNQNGTLENFSHPLKTDGLGDTASYPKPADATNVTTAITNLNDYVNAGWKIAEGDNADAKARISPNEQVNFKAAGLATVSVAANGTGANVTYTVTKGEFKDDTTDGTISAKTDKGDKAATVNDVSNAINRAYWKATAAGNGVTTDTPDQVTAGTEVTFKAGKNLTVDHKTAKTFTFATVDTPNFKGVELVDKNATDNKKLTLTPTDAGDLKLNKGTNEAAKITNVVSGLEKFDENNPLINGHTLEELTMSQDPAYSGLTNLADKNVQDKTAATVGDLRGMGWVVSSNKTTDKLTQEYTAQVKNANEVKFVGTGVAVVSAKTDKNNENTRTITVDVAKGTLVEATTDAKTGNTVNANRGKVTVKSGDDNKVATVKNVADAINSAGTIIKAVNEHDTAITDTDETKNDDGEVVKAGDDVTYKAGKNLRVKRDTRNLTFALANDITVNNANVDTKLTIGKTNPVGITSDTNGLNFATTEGTNTNAPVYLNGVKSTLQDTIVAAATPNLEKVDKDVTTFTAAEKARAASVQDVLNSGWNIRGKKQATDADVANVDFVRTYDTVDFISGDANTTEVTVNAKDDNKRTEVSIKAKIGETDVVTAADTGKKVGQVKAKANAGTTTDQGSNLATVNAVANAVNRAYWKATAAGNGVTGTDTPDQVTAGTEVTFKAGKNLAVDHSTANTFEFKTKDEVEFTSVQIGGTDGPKLTKDGNALKVSAADGSAPVRITNVAAGEKDNDAVSYKQFKEIKTATDNTIKLTAIDNVKGTQNKTETTTSDQKLNQADGINFKLASADNDLLSVKAAGDTVTFTPKLGKVEVTDGKAVEATSKTGLVEAEELTEALNKLGWKTKATEKGSTATATDQEINAGDSVNYEDGQGTTAKVEITKGATNPDTGISTPDTVSVKYDVKAADNTIDVSDAGVKVNTGSIELAKTDEKANDRGKVTITPKAKVDGGTETQEEANKRAETEVATVKNVAEAINSAGTIIKAANKHNETITDTDETKDDKGETVKAGDEVTYTAGKNLRVKRDDRNLTFALANEIEVEKATATKSLTIGEGDNTTTLTSDEDGLSVAGKNDAPRKVTNVAEGTETLVFDKEGNQLVEIGGKFYDTADIDDQGLPKADAKEKTPLKDTDTDADAYAKAASGLADLSGSDQTNALTVADAGKLGWVMSAGGNSTAVQNADEVIFNAKDGVNITSHFDANSGKYNVDFGLKVDKDADNILNVTEDGVSVLKGELEAAATTGTTRGKVTVKEADQTGDNQVATVNNVAAAINSAKWFAKAENLEEGLTDRAQKDTDEEAAAIGAGDLIALKADKNLAVKREGTSFTYGLAKDIGVNSITLGTAETAVNLSTSAGALKVAGKDGNAAQITNVKAGAEVVTFDKEGNQIVKKGDKYVTLDEAGNPTDIEATPATEEELSKLDPRQKALAGLADLYGSKGTNALTVEDARNLGWVVSAGDHSAAVTNTDEVVFEGTNGVDVSAKSENGVHTITVGIKDGDVVKSNRFTAKVGGVDTSVIKVGDQYYKVKDIDPKTGAPKENVNAVTVDANTTPTNAGTGYVTGNKVADAIQQSGFVLGKQKAPLVASDYKDADATDEVVNPNDEVRFADGNNTKVKLTTKESVDATGNKVTTTTVKVDVNGLPVQYTTADGTPVTKVDDKFYKVDEQGNPTGDAVDRTTLVAKVINPTAKANETGRSVTLGNIAEGTETLVFDKEGNQLVEIGGKFYDTEDLDKTTGLLKPNAEEKTPLKATDTDADAYAKAASGLADLAGSDQTNALTVADAGKLGWVMSAGGHSTAVQNADEVIFNAKDGVNITSHFDATSGKYNVDFGIKVDKDADNILNVSEDGVSVLKGELEAAATTGTTRGKVTVKDAEQTGDNQVATVNNVAAAINSAKWFAKAENLEEGLTDRAQKDTDEEAAAIGAGDLIALKADKNLAVKREGTSFTYGLAKDIGVNSITLGTAETAVNLSTSAGALKVAGKDGNAAQITNVKAGAEVVTFDKEGNQIVKKGDKYVTLDEAGNPTDIEATPATEEELSKLDPRQKALAGLADLYGSKGTNALTVEDARNLGWVVSAGDHSAAVTNTDEVVFEGTNGVDVSAKSENGVHTITVGIKDGDVVKSNRFTAKVGGVDTSVIKVGDQYYKVKDIDPKTGAPKENVNAVTVDANTTPTNAGTGYVTGNKVADAIQQSGFVLGKQKAPLVASDYKDADATDEVVNPNDEVRFADGNNTKVKLTTKESVDATGNKVTTTTVKVDVNGLPVQYTTADGTPVTKVDDKFYKVDEQGNPTGDAVDRTTLVAKVINPTAKANETGRSVTLGNIAEGTETLVFDKEGNQLVEIGGKFYDTEDLDKTTGLLKPNAEEKTPLKATDTDADAYAKAASGLADLAGSDQTNALTVADAGKLGWVMSAGGNSTAVQNADEVIFNAKDGVNITSHFDANSGKYNVDFGLKVDKDADNILNVTEDGVSVLKGELEAAATTGTTRGKVTVKEADQTGDNQVATVNNVAAAINSAKWFAKAENLEEGLTDRAQKDTDEEAAAIGAGDLIALKADKNLAVKREGTSFTYGLAKDIGVNSITLGTAETAVNLSTSAGALKVAGKDGNAAQITNVKAGAEVVTFDKEGNQIVKKGDKYVTLDEAGNPTDIEATPATEEELSKLDPRQKALAGLADLYGSKGTNALTVEDARNLGWVVSAGDHSAAVTNTDEVVFEGTNGVDVSAKSENGVHTITVGIKDGDVVKSNRFTAKVGGVDTSVIKVGDQYYKVKDIDPKTGAPKENVNAVTVDANTTPTNAGTGYVTGNKVADAIQQSGFVLGKQKAPLVASDYKDADATDEVVNPNDEVRFADGNNTKVKLTTKESVDATGNKVTTTTVKVDVNGLPVQYTTADGTPVTKVDDKFYKVDEQGNPTGDAVDRTTLVAKVINPTAKANETGRSVTLGNIAEGTETLVFDKEGNQLVEIGGKFYDTEDLDKTTGLLKPNAEEKTPLKATDTDADAYAKAASGLADLAGSDQTNALTVADAGKLGWVMSAGGHSTAVQNADEVIFNAKDGVNITSHFDATSGKYNVDFGIKVDKDADNILNVSEDGVSVLKGELEAAATTGTTRGKVTVKDAEQTGDNQVATVNNVAAAINSAKWFAKAENLEEGLTDRAQKDTDEEAAAIGAGDLIALKADKNLAVKREGTSFTYGLAKDIGVNSITLGTAETAVNLSTSAGALKVAGKDGNAAQITNVKAGAEVVTFDKEGNQIVKKGDKYVTLDEAGNPTDIEATPATEEELSKLDPRQKALAGLADLYGSKGTNALTVEDARNLGWVVSAGDHSAAVTNTDEVVFEGTNGVDVSAKSENGVHTITVGIKDGDVVKSNRFTAKVGGVDTSVIKVGDQYYKVKDIDPKTGAPKENVNAVTVDANTTPTNAGTGYVTGNKVADAIQQSGFVLGKQKAPLVASDYKDADATDEVVNPNDEVRFADGNNTKVKLTTKESVDATGNKVTTTTVKVDVNGLPVQYTTADGTPVTKVDDKFYKVDEQGNPTGDAVDRTTLVAKVINPTAKANETGRSVTLGNVANGAKTFDAAKDAEGNDLVKANDGLWYKETDVEANGTLKPKASSATPVTSDSSAGLVDFTKSKPNNVATVGDLQNIGWVMSTSDNGYTDQVRNANKVDFKGGNGIEVKGKTLTDGTREITVAIKEGDVTKSNEFTAPDGTKLTKIGDNYYRQGDIDIHTGKPKSSEVKALYKAEGGKVFAIDQVTGNIKPSEEAKLVNKDNGYVTGNKVADAIAQSGWNIGLGDDAKASEAFADPTKALSANTLEKVNPNDNLRFANGKNTKVSAATVESTDENGDKVTTTYVKTDVELPLSQLSATDAAGNKVVKGADGKWYPAKADGSADTAKEAVDGRTVRQETVLDPDNKGEKYKALTEQPTSADNNAISRAQSDALKDQKVVDAKAQLAKTLAQAGQSAEVITAALEGIDNAVRDEVKAKYLKDNGLDKGTAGSVITNVAWGQKPSDAVNVDQLQNSGWNLDSKAVAGTNGKVTTINTAATKVKMDETVNINAGQNIEITRHGKSVEIATSMNPNFDSVKLGKGNKAVMLNSTADGALSVEGAKVTNVAKGRITSGSTDAINGGQLYDVASQVSQHLGNLNHRINKVGKNADAGTASALAASQLPQAYIPGKSMVAVAGGTYQGQNGLALGVSRTSDNGKVIIRLSGTANSQGKKGVAAGIGYQW